MNQKGYSWPEAMLTLSALVVIFGTLLPLATNMTTTLQRKKLAMHAAETAYHGMIAYDAYGKPSGTREVDGMNYKWHVANHSICVTYAVGDEVTSKCIGSN